MAVATALARALKHETEIVIRSEEDENFSHVTFDVLLLLTDNVESDSLREGSALANGNDIADFDAEGG